LFSATFSNISAISWRQVLVVEETGVPGDHDIAEILLKVALNKVNQIKSDYNFRHQYFPFMFCKWTTKPNIY
jgi:hypothetical protein